VTIPKELREKIGIDSGSFILIEETQAGYVIRKQMKEDCLSKYMGILGGKASSDEVVKELRGE
jgi:AbrB family looped-hinge helix DNA binding protein